MKTNSLFWALTWAAAGSLAIMQGCGGDDDDDGGDGGDDKGGSSGSGGTTGGSSGSSGKGGTSGASGSAGKGGTSGSTSTGGSGGAPGGEGGGGGVPGGGGEGGAGATRAAVCADYCSAYYDAGCEAFDGGFYGTEAGCASLCEMAVWALGEPGDAMGNSVQCRLSHAEFAAAASDPEMHCGHAAADSTGNCVN
jgi:hypothetical protein